jgi:hypothetical protein
MCVLCGARNINKLICGLESIKTSTMEINNDKSCGWRGKFMVIAMMFASLLLENICFQFVELKFMSHYVDYFFDCLFFEFRVSQLGLWGSYLVNQILIECKKVLAREETLECRCF